MSTLSQGNSILVDTPEDTAAAQQAFKLPDSELTSWIIDRVDRWESHRNRGYATIWAEYWRMWRGQWSEADRNRLSERSRLIAPALSQAIEMTVSELEEAIWSKEVWFDIADDIADQDKMDALTARDLLLEDFDAVKAEDALTEALLNAAIFGTGVVKLNTYVSKAQKPKRNDKGALEAYGDERVYVCVESVRPDEFIPDPAGRTIQEMLGCAHRVQKPLHSVLEKIEQGVYLKSALPRLGSQQMMGNSDVDYNDPQSSQQPSDSDQVTITEYHGKVPLAMLAALGKENTPLDDALVREELDEGDGALIEAIVTIANGSVLLRAIANPFTMTDRSIIAFQHEKVPGRFWGRGVSEKGYNPQKALDAEVRARIDALGFISAPMIAIDSGRVPRGFKMEIKPGKVWLTQGPPGEVIQPIKIGEINAATFNQASEMERMVQMGTGSFDTASSLKSQSASGANSLSSNSMMMGAFVKRAKRAIRNVDRNLLQPVIEKALWRYMQFDPRRYPQDYKFGVKATMGIVAREVEAMQMTQLIGMIPEQFGSVSMTLVQGIIEHSTIPNKAQILQQVNQALQPPSPEEQKKQQDLKDLQYEAVKAQAQGELLKNQKTIAEIRKLLAEAHAAAKKGDIEDDRLIQEQQRIALMDKEIDAFTDQNRIAMMRVALQDKALDLKAQQMNQQAASK